MAVKIVKRGELPEKKIYSTLCRNCKTEFTFAREDAKQRTAEYNSTELVIDCPLCKQQCWVSL